MARKGEGGMKTGQVKENGRTQNTNLNIKLIVEF